MVDLILRVHGTGAGDDVIPPGQRFGPDEFQQQPGDGPVIVPEDDAAVGQSLHGALVKDHPLGGDGREQTQLLAGGAVVRAPGQHPGAEPLDITADFFKVGTAGLGPAAVQQQTPGGGYISRGPGPQLRVAPEQGFDFLAVGSQGLGPDGVIEADNNLVGPRGVRFQYMGRGGVHDGGPLPQKHHPVQTVRVAGAVHPLNGLALLLGLLGQLLHQGGFAAAWPAFDEIHLHPRLPPQGLKIAFEPGGCGGTEEEINGFARGLHHERTPRFCYKAMQKRGGLCFLHGSVSVLAHLPDLLPQGQEIRKGVRFILLLAEQGGGVERAHEPDAAFFNKGAVLFGHGEIRPDHPLGGNAAQADHDLGLQDAELFPQPGHTGLALGRERVAVLGRAALDDVGDVAVLVPVQVDGKQVFIQQLAAAAHKRQALLILALAGTLAHKQHFGRGYALPEHHVGAGGMQRATGAGEALGA